jgi:protein-disulfide isomerase
VEHEKEQSHEKHKDNEAFKIRKTTFWQAATFFFALLFIGSLFTGGFGFSGVSIGTGKIAAPTAAAPSGGGAPPPAEVDFSAAPIKGSSDAPVTIVEFSDFQCPFCSRFHSDTLPQIENEYIKTGKVQFAYMHFPLDTIHPQATPAALASECANEQGKFWEYHNLIFQNQQSLGDAGYKAWAQQLSLDTQKFDECYASQKYIGKVRGDLQKGSAAGIQGTPGFLVNGQLVSGAQPFSVFKQVIDAALSG